MAKLRKSSEKITFGDFYDARYSESDPFWGLLNVSKHVKAIRFLQELIGNQSKGSRVLDIGCGNGRFANRMAKLFEVYACDSADETMEKNRIKYPSVKFFSANAVDESFKVPGSVLFDAVTCMDVIEHIPFDLQETLLKNIFNVLKPGGQLVLSTPDRSVSLQFKVNDRMSDEEFLRRRERQPRADQLTGDQLDQLLRRHFEIQTSESIVPAVGNRLLDLTWKTLAFITAYRLVTPIAIRLGSRCQYLFRSAKKPGQLSARSN